MRQCPKCGKRFLGDDLTVCDTDGAQLQSVLVSTGRDRLVNTVIEGRYEITGVLGDGGMGVVYRARSLVDQKTYAIKVLRAEYTSDADLVSRFEQEAEAVSKIDHPNIVEVIEFGSLPDQSRFFVMEYLPGQSLGQLLASQPKRPGTDRREPIEEALTLDIARQICAGLHAAHQLGIVHRDMKPDNVHLLPRASGGYDVRVLDFGIAKVQGSQSARTRTGSVFGTPHYMSPEQAQGERDVDARTDVYAVGILLYQMTTGRVPFDADNLMAILTAHLYHYPPSPTSLTDPGQVSPALEAVILRALGKERGERYRSMLAFAEDLERIQRHEPTIAEQDALERVTAGISPASIPPAWSSNAATNTKLTVPSGRITNVSKNIRAAEVTTRDGVPSGTGQSIPPVTASSLRARGRRSLVLVAAGALFTGAAGAAVLFALRHESHVRTARPPPALSAPTAPTASIRIAVPPSQTRMPPTVQEPTATIHLASDPPGATLERDGLILGSTPFDAPRPAHGSRTDYTLTATGRAPFTVTLDENTPAALDVVLPQRAPSGSGRVQRHGARHGELIDPWAH